MKRSRLLPFEDMPEKVRAEFRTSAITEGRTTYSSIEMLNEVKDATRKQLFAIGFFKGKVQALQFIISILKSNRFLENGFINALNERNERGNQ